MQNRKTSTSQIAKSLQFNSNPKTTIQISLKSISRIQDEEKRIQNHIAVGKHEANFATQAAAPLGQNSNVGNQSTSSNVTSTPSPKMKR